MSLPLKTPGDPKIDKVMQSLQRARDLVRSREEFGVDGIDNFVQDVDGDWLERWSCESSLSLQEKKIARTRTITRFLMALVCQVNNPKISMELMV